MNVLHRIYPPREPRILLDEDPRAEERPHGEFAACPTCGGEGLDKDLALCHRCHATGRVWKTEEGREDQP